MRRLVKKAQEDPKVLESLRELFKEMPEQKSRETDLGQFDKGIDRLAQIEKQAQTLQAVAEKAKEHSEVAQRVRKLLEETRRKLDTVGPVPNTRCLDVLASTASWKPFPAANKAGLTGQGIAVDYQLKVTNNCEWTVDDTEFQVTEAFTCPANCEPPELGSGAETDHITSIPSTLSVKGSGVGTLSTLVYCEQVDSNFDATELVQPESITTTVVAVGNAEVINEPVTAPEGVISVYP
jgi:hypothetical protein